VHDVRRPAPRARGSAVRSTPTNAPTAPGGPRDPTPSRVAISSSPVVRSTVSRSTDRVSAHALEAARRDATARSRAARSNGTQQSRHERGAKHHRGPPPPVQAGAQASLRERRIPRLADVSSRGAPQVGVPSDTSPRRRCRSCPGSKARRWWCRFPCRGSPCARAAARPREQGGPDTVSRVAALSGQIRRATPVLEPQVVPEPRNSVWQRCTWP